MPEWRKLYRSISDSKKLAKLKSDSPALFWTWMLPYTDCEGRVLADPHYLQGKVVPRLQQWDVKKVEKILKELHDVELIQLYEADGETIAQFEQPQFEEHQSPRRDREAKSKFPAPPPRDSSGTPAELPPNSDKLQSTAGELPLRLDKSRVEESRVGELRGQDLAELPPNSGVSQDPPPPPSFSEIKKLIIEIWNKFADAHNLKRVITIAEGSQREKHFRARNEEPAFDFPKIIFLADGMDFCFGANDMGWKISFDWIIKNPGNYIQILEEKYLDDDKKEKEFKVKEKNDDPY